MHHDTRYFVDTFTNSPLIRHLKLYCVGVSHYSVLYRLSAKENIHFIIIIIINEYYLGAVKSQELLEHLTRLT